ncbi:hypothetical protein GGS20DRAFT_547746 [Poronia punctata]|nr:hypothetical protein GGS20DRAFT_547746 [Poronia punctata]
MSLMVRRELLLVGSSDQETLSGGQWPTTAQARKRPLHFCLLPSSLVSVFFHLPLVGAMLGPHFSVVRVRVFFRRFHRWGRGRTWLQSSHQFFAVHCVCGSSFGLRHLPELLLVHRYPDVAVRGNLNLIAPPLPISTHSTCSADRWRNNNWKHKTRLFFSLPTVGRTITPL